MQLGKGIIMSKKNGRPESKNAEYFPHHTEVSSELNFLEMTHNAEGYRAFWRILEQLCGANDHYIKLETEREMLTFRYGCKVPVEILDDCIDYLVEVGFINKSLWEEEETIWIQTFVELFRGVYYKRGRDLPKKDHKELSDTRNMQESNIRKEN